jgi:tetratricopeptide (TPR) repeat protein
MLATPNDCSFYMVWAAAEKRKRLRFLDDGISTGMVRLSFGYIIAKEILSYKHIFFIDASSVESIKADLQSAIRSLGGTHSQDTFEDSLRFLAHPDNHDWLVIFDNADDPDLPLTTFIPEGDHGTAIITGRNLALAKLSPTAHWHLQGMGELESIQVLLKAAQREVASNEAESNAVTDLSRLLGGLPLALVHAGNYCDTTKIAFSEYLERFKSHRSKLMTMQPPLQLDKYSYSTYTSIKLSYSLLDEQARDLLHLLSFFHPSNIRLDILRVASKHGFELHKNEELLPWDHEHNSQSDTLQRLLMPDGSWSDVYIDSLLNQLQSSSLITLSHSNDRTSTTIHPLVQSCILDTLAQEVYTLYFSMAVIVLSSCSFTEELPLFQHLSVHIVELESRKMVIHPNHSSALAYMLYKNGNYEEAMKRREKVREECRRANGGEHRSTLRMSFWIAECLLFMQRLEAAEELIREVVKTQERVLGEDSDAVLDSYQALAEILKFQQQTEEAETILKRLLALSENKNGQRHRRTLRIQWSLAANLHLQKRYSEAEALSRSVLPMTKEVLGDDVDTTLATLNTLSAALMDQGKWAEAEDILRELITKTTLTRGKHHPHTLLFQFNFTLCLIQRESFDEAEKILEEVVKVQEKILGKDHPSTINSRTQLEYVIRQQTVPRPANSLFIFLLLSSCCCWIVLAFSIEIYKALRGKS